MNVCLLGIPGEKLDEGMKNFGIHLYQELAELVDEVKLLDVSQPHRLEFWRKLRGFDPDVIHLIPGPTFKGLSLLRTAAKVTAARAVVTATQPRFNRIGKRLLPFVGPDAVFVQSNAMKPLFETACRNVYHQPSGVDLDQFYPVAEEEQRDLRADLGIPQDEFAFLHVGHFKRGRNIDALTALLEYGEVIVIGSTSTRQQQDLVTDLEASGCRVVTDYVEAIERYYQACDCYVFPTTDTGNSIQIPLSVLEAMACNKPVFTTEFGGLPNLFEEGDGLRFIESVDEIPSPSKIDADAVRTREKVSPHSWTAIAEDVVEVYESL